MAAQLDGYFDPKNRVPAPPIEWPANRCVLSSILNSFRIMSKTVRTSFSLNSARLGGSMGRPAIAITGEPYHPETLYPKAPDYVSAFIRKIDQAVAHQEVAVAAHPMQSHDQRIFLVLCYFGRHIKNIAQIFIGCCEVVFALLHSGIRFDLKRHFGHRPSIHLRRLGKYGLVPAALSAVKQNVQRAEYDIGSIGDSHGSFSFDVLHAFESVSHKRAEDACTTGEHWEAEECTRHPFAAASEKYS